jgi:N-acyl homoserine lactone hydrolase
MRDIIIHPIPLFITDTKFDKARMTYLYNFGEGHTGCCYTWLLEGAGEKMMVDTGGTAETAIARGRSREDVKKVQTLEDGLAKYGLKPGDIDTVIITHLHWDHVELAHKYVNARLIVQEDELNFSRNPHPAALYDDRRLLEGLDFEVVRGDCQITDGVKVLLTPGHTPGGQSIAVETEKGVAIITGFCCIQENFEPSEEIRKKTPIIVPGIHLDVIQSYDSMLKVKEAADIIIPIHDPKFTSIDSLP